MKGWCRMLPLAALLTGGLAAAGCGGKGELDVHKLEPNKGNLKGGQPVKIRGSNFRTGIGYTVYFGNRRADQVSVLDGETMLAATPERDKAATVDLIIAADDGPAWKVHDAFQFAEASATSPEEGKGTDKLKY